MNNIDALKKVFNDEKIRYNAYMSPRGTAFKLEVDYKKQMYEAQLFYNEGLAIISIEIHSAQAVNPEHYYNVQAIMYDLNHKRKEYIWQMIENGFYYLRHKSYYEWSQITNIPSGLIKLCNRFSSCSPYIENIARGQKDYFDIYTELKKLGMVN